MDFFKDIGWVVLGMGVVLVISWLIRTKHNEVMKERDIEREKLARTVEELRKQRAIILVTDQDSLLKRVDNLEKESSDQS